MDKKPFVSLQETVIIGYTDIAAAGCRALLGLSGRKTEVPFEVPGISTHPCCSTGEKTRGDLKPFVVLNCNYMLYSLVIVNTHIPSKISHRLAKYITDACSNSHVRRIMVLAALRLDILEPPIRRMYENSWNGMTRVTSCQGLPPELKFCDAFLSNLMQMLLVIETMQQYIGDITLLGFSLDNSKSLIYHGNTDEHSDMVARIYV